MGIDSGSDNYPQFEIGMGTTTLVPANSHTNYLFAKILNAFLHSSLSIFTILINGKH